MNHKFKDALSDEIIWLTSNSDLTNTDNEDCGSFRIRTKTWCIIQAELLEKNIQKAADGTYSREVWQFSFEICNLISLHFFQLHFYSMKSDIFLDCTPSLFHLNFYQLISLDARSQFIYQSVSERDRQFLALNNHWWQLVKKKIISKHATFISATRAV